MRGTGSKFTYIVAAVVLAVIVFSGSNIRTIFRLRSQLNHYRRRIQATRAENEHFEEKIRLIENEDEHFEYLARKQLGLIKEGETKYYIIKQTETESTDGDLREKDLTE